MSFTSDLHEQLRAVREAPSGPPAAPVNYVVRRVLQKRVARLVADQCGGEVWIDGPHSWAVVRRENSNVVNA